MVVAGAREQSPVRDLVPFLLVVAMWASLTLDGLFTFFSGDDLMNLYKVFTEPSHPPLKGILHFWSSDYYRPLGGLVYLGLYEGFGFDPRPFRIAGFAILLGNLWLGLHVLWRLLGSPRRAALALLLMAYNARMNDLYLNFGTVYEALCFAFYYGAFLWWMRIRDGGRSPRPVEHAGILSLYLLALGAKEMAVSFPVVLLAYELLLAPRDAPWREHSLAAARRVAPYVLLTVVFLVGKLQGPESLARLDAYRPSMDLGSYLHASSHYLNNVFLVDWCSPGRAAAAILGALALTVATGSPQALFGLVLFLVSLLPVSFIVPRSGFVLYLGTLGLGTWAVALLDWAAARWRRQGAAVASEGWPAFLIALALLWPIHYHFKQVFDGHVKGFIRRNQDFYESFLRTGLRPLPGDRVLLLNDPYDDDVYDPLFLLALARHDPTLELHRATDPSRSLEPLSRYAYVLEYAGGEMTVLKSPGRIAPGLERAAARLGARLPPD
jgi:hypothetical protein